MSHHIDVSSMLRKSVCELYSNLVTRPTGSAVRSEIEQEIDKIGERTLTIIDFSHVGLLDYSCADEIVAKLLLQYVALDAPRREVYFVFRGIGESHMDAIEAVLQRHQLALVSQLADGAARVIGCIEDHERKAWETVARIGGCPVPDFADVAGMDCEEAERVLERLWQRRLLVRYNGGYAAVGAATPGVLPVSNEH